MVTLDTQSGFWQGTGHVIGDIGNSLDTQLNSCQESSIYSQISIKRQRQRDIKYSVKLRNPNCRITTTIFKKS